MPRQGRRPKLTDETLRAIVSSLQNQAEKPPAGFYTREQWSKRWKLKRTATARYLDKGVETGVVEKRWIRTDLGSYVRKTPYWGLAKKKR